MWRLMGLVSMQTLFLTSGQVLLKLAMQHLGKFEWSRTYIKSVITSGWLFACGISFSIAMILWMYILKKFPFSQAYPLTSLSFVFGMIAAWLIFGESVPVSRWVGLIFVVVGCFLIMK